METETVSHFYSKTRSLISDTPFQATIEEATPETPSSEKKKKKKKKKAAEEAEGDSQADLTAEVEQMEVDTAESPKKKKKKKKAAEAEAEEPVEEAAEVRFDSEGVLQNFTNVRTITVGCVFPMVVVFVLSHADFRPNDHRENATHFTKIQNCSKNIFRLRHPRRRKRRRRLLNNFSLLTSSK